VNEMRNEMDNNSCLFGEQLVSYIYKELPAAGRDAFEVHLLDCSSCTDEFASISMSRLGVYEWHRDDFLPLETPVFTIPYERPVVVTEVQPAWVDALRGLFSPARVFALGGGLAVLTIIFATAYVSNLDNGTSVAEANMNSTPAVSRETAEPKPYLQEPKVGIDNEVAEAKVSVQESETPASKPDRAVPVKATKRQVNNTRAVQASVPQKAPRLGTYDEAEDTSLRLADLVADIDTDDF
jgi:hypothetical protein